MTELDQSILQAQRSYEGLHHSAAETELYAQFRDQWNRYREIAGGIVTHSAADRKPSAVRTYMTSSRVAYDEETMFWNSSPAQCLQCARSERARLILHFDGMLVYSGRYGGRRIDDDGRAILRQALGFCAAFGPCRLHATARRQRR